MNQKDYKEIAKIFKEDNISWRNKHEKNTYHRLANNLADYFEKEDNKFNEGIKFRDFNKKQFLKDCGVEE